MKSISGRHLIIDAYVRDGAVLDDPNRLCDLLDELVETLGMRYLQRPTAIRVPTDAAALATNADDGGWSVICQITTSHIALHGWPQRKAFMMDIFSCLDYDVDAARHLVCERLGVTELNVHDIRRSDPRGAPQALRGERASPTERRPGAAA